MNSSIVSQPTIMVLINQSSGKFRTCMAVCAVNVVTFTVWAFVTQLAHEQLRHTADYGEAQSEDARQVVSMLWIFGAAFFLSFCWCCCCCCCCCGFSNLDKRFTEMNEDQLELDLRLPVVFTVPTGNLNQETRISFPPPPPRWTPYVPPSGNLLADRNGLHNAQPSSSRSNEEVLTIPSLSRTPPPSYEEALRSL